MTDYPALYRQIARDTLKLEGELQGDTLQFVKALVRQLQKDGYVLTEESEAVMTHYLDAMKAAIGMGITKAAATASQTSMQSDVVLKLAEASFKRHH